MPRTESAAKLIRYLQAMRQTRQSAGTPETSFYAPLQTLLDEIGAELKPQVMAIGQLADVGFGSPDFGFFIKKSLKREDDGSIITKPERGVAEVKPLSAEINDIMQSAQVEKYINGYGVVLVTNYRDFALVEMAGGKVVAIARYQIAATEEEFWQMAAKPNITAEEHSGRLCEFLQRALLHNAPIRSPEDLARIFASCAREALDLLEQNRSGESSALKNLREDLESSLSMKFEGDKGDHFFCSTLAQTILYGLFSAWMESDDNTFDWKTAGYLLTNPVMQSLFGWIVSPSSVGQQKGLKEILDQATAALKRVQSKEQLFGDADADTAISHFYEPFLAEFDPDLRKEMGVWYTPPEIVKYMVERADRVLRTELKITEGFADDNVYVLDPCGGTGAYIAEVLQRIHQTCTDNGDGALAAQRVKKAAQERVIGFEILSASYVIAHWQIGNLLTKMGAGLDAKKKERAAIYLTNSLTNWEAIEHPPLGFPGLQAERDAANKIKQQKPILVILGNPPYNAYAGTSPKEENDLIDPYKEGLPQWGVHSGNLNDLYIRFFAMAQKRISKTGRGVVSFISNYSYTEEPLFVVMREKLLQNFNKAWIENMHGDRNKSERAPDGRASNTVFAMRGVSPGIRQGIVIGLFCKKNKSKSDAAVLYRNDIDSADAEKRRAQLLASLNNKNFNSHYEIANPQRWNKLSFRPLKVSDNFLQWADLSAIGECVYNGPIERRGMSLIPMQGDEEKTFSAVVEYLDADIENKKIIEIEPRFMKSSGEFFADVVRERLLKKVEEEKLSANREKMVAYPFKPFDLRSAYLDAAIATLFSRPRPELIRHAKDENWFFVTRNVCKVAGEGAPAIAAETICDYAVISGGSRHFPIYLYVNAWEIFASGNKGIVRITNLSKAARTYLKKLEFANPDEDREAAEILWLHSLAVCYAPQYQDENTDGLKIGWPRIPLPKAAEALQHSAALGKKIRMLLDMQSPSLSQADLNRLAVLRGDSNRLALSSRWGYKDGKGKVYPGKGDIAEMTNPPAALSEKFGTLLEVRLNDSARWECVPKKVWDYRIGGFQPAKKWLSYRAETLLNRPLNINEVRTFADIIRRIAALILLEDELNKNYQTLKKLRSYSIDDADK